MNLLTEIRIQHTPLIMIVLICQTGQKASRPNYAPAKRQARLEMCLKRESWNFQLYIYKLCTGFRLKNPPCGYQTSS
jgi:hypothetical protein